MGIAGINPDHHVQDLFEAIERKDYPSWTAYIQVMTQQQAETYRWNIFDMTKVWPYKDYPLRPFGKLSLDRNVKFGVLCTVLSFILSSLRIILQISNRQHSHLLRWFQELNLQLTPVCLPIPFLICYANSSFSASGSDVQLPRCCPLSLWSQLPTATY